MAVTFQKLWQNHPTTKGENQPCKKKDGTDAFKHQCAIRMSIALAGAGMSLKTFSGARCWFGHGGKHILRANELFKWLKTQSSQIGKVAVHTGVTYQDFKGKTGIVFFEDFWGPGNSRDHIDLWDGQQVRKGDLDYFERSKKVWFWKIK